MPRDRQESSSELRADMQTLTEHVQILWQVLDEIRDELRWQNNNFPELGIPPAEARRRVTLTSMSADPTAADFRVNAVDEETISQLRQEVAAEQQPGAGNSQPSLFT